MQKITKKMLVTLMTRGGGYRVRFTEAWKGMVGRELGARARHRPFAFPEMGQELSVSDAIEVLSRTRSTMVGVTFLGVIIDPNGQEIA